jgi:hypothetical protein
VLTWTVAADGDVVERAAPLFFLDSRTLQELRTTDSAAVLEGTTVKLNAEAADLLNQSAGTEALEAGLEIGTAKIVVRPEAPQS